LRFDETIGSLLQSLDDMGIANDTIVVYTSAKALVSRPEFQTIMSDLESVQR